MTRNHAANAWSRTNFTLLYYTNGRVPLQLPPASCVQNFRAAGQRDPVHPSRFSLFWPILKLPEKGVESTAIYCNDTAIYNNNLLHLVVLQLYFLLFRHRNTDYFLLRYTTVYCILTAIYCLYYFLLQFTASYRDLPRFTAQVGPQCSVFKSLWFKVGGKSCLYQVPGLV